MAKDEHTYPSNYTPGTHWATDEAWKILDTLRPGALDAAARAFLAGMIVGTLMRIRADDIHLTDSRTASRAMAEAMEHWRGLKRPDLSEEDKVGGALLFYQRQLDAAEIMRARKFNDDA